MAQRFKEWALQTLPTVFAEPCDAERDAAFAALEAAIFDGTSSRPKMGRKRGRSTIVSAAALWAVLEVGVPRVAVLSCGVGDVAQFFEGVDRLLWQDSRLLLRYRETVEQYRAERVVTLDRMEVELRRIKAAIVGVPFEEPERFSIAGLSAAGPWADVVFVDRTANVVCKWNSVERSRLRGLCLRRLEEFGRVPVVEFVDDPPDVYDLGDERETPIAGPMSYEGIGRRGSAMRLHA